ncbi:hypothetical protein [Streptomyces sp. NPDC001536]|uniref:hypothetical protein n=1 Tax=Streptomyces sp. NPDC001536 TaxID=3364583 RepID=UPI0036B72B50
MKTPRLEEVRLTPFKSFTEQRLPPQDLMVLIGRYGSGKSSLYPTQAARVLRLMKEQSQRRRIDVLFTRHSPALLNSLTAQTIRALSSAAGTRTPVRAS